MKTIYRYQLKKTFEQFQSYYLSTRHDDQKETMDKIRGYDDELNRLNKQIKS